MLLFQTAQTLIDAFFAMNISFYRGGIMTLIQVLGAFKNGWGYLGCFKDASLRAGIMLQKWACFQREEIQAWPDSMHRVICLKMSRTWIRWSGHESTYIYYVLESQRLEFPFQAKSLMESQKKKKKNHMLSVENWKGYRALSAIMQKTQRLAKPMFTGTKGIHSALMLLTALSSRIRMCSIQHILEENIGKNSWLYTSHTLLYFELWIQAIKL